jgi:hypothetical protein
MSPTAALLHVAPTVGAEFNARDFAAHVDGCSKYNVRTMLHALRDDALVEFTGRPLVWRRTR